MLPQDAISFAAQQPRVDPERIGVWGESYSGQLALAVGAVDDRVRAVISITPQVAAPDPEPDRARFDAFCKAVEGGGWEGGAEDDWTFAFDPSQAGGHSMLVRRQYPRYHESGHV